MDILIKGVKMPKKGQYLQILIAENGEMSYEHVYYNSPSAGFKLHKSKAVALPEHGRLGDLDKLQKKVEDCAFVPEQSKTMYMIAVEKEIRDAPTIVEATE